MRFVAVGSAGGKWFSGCDSDSLAGAVRDMEDSAARALQVEKQMNQWSGVEAWSVESEVSDGGGTLSYIVEQQDFAAQGGWKPTEERLSYSKKGALEECWRLIESAARWKVFRVRAVETYEVIAVSFGRGGQSK